MSRDGLPTLEVDEFPAFFQALWGPNVTPFDWQLELLRQVHDKRAWPDLIDLPTGSGKTSTLDIAVFLLALDAGRPAAERWMPRRIALIVDRRVVVDQADERGAAIRRRLVAALPAAGQNSSPAADPDDLLRRVAVRLCHLSGTEVPLVTTVLRGGIVRDETWAQRPDVPALISSTVDQVGSRLLFRGYGLSRGMRPIHAGLLANDTLFLLDEVHLARPFTQTLTAVGRYRNWHAGTTDMPDRWQVVQMSATPASPVERTFPARPIEPGSHPVLRRRLMATKPATTGTVNVPSDPVKANEKFAAACAKRARHLLDSDHLRTIGVIVNRVDTARRAARVLVDQLGPDHVCLLTGRMRGIDRERVLNAHRHRLETGRTRAPDDPPFVIVATQSIEAGADFDLDGIVTECASVDALRQRFGRVDRDGQLAATGTPSQSVILIRSTDITPKEDDPVYGPALPATWSWLQHNEQIDFGITHLSLPDDDTLAAMVAAGQDAPRLFPTHLDQWVQTSQKPSETEPDVARWLHGLDADEQQVDVELVWRSDLDASLFVPDALDIHGAPFQGVIDRVAAAPPTTSEALAIPLVAFRRWARGDGQDVSTADTASSEEGDEVWQREGQARSYLRWTGTTGDLVPLNRIRPGDTVILPASAGGLWLGNWDPAATDEHHDAVEDVATSTIARQRRQAVVRLTDQAVAHWWVPVDDGDTDEESVPAGPAAPNPDEFDELPKSKQTDAVRELIDQILQQPTPEAPVEVLRHLRRSPLTIRALPQAVKNGRVRHSYVVTTTRRMPGSATGLLAPDDGTDALSFTARAVPLDDHLAGVEAVAAHFAAALGIPSGLRTDLALAGLLHDIGKADPRFQLLLHDGDEIAAALAESRRRPLAKSASTDNDRAQRQQARSISGYPQGARHEMLSLAMIDDHDSVLKKAVDPELVRHLVMSHHGFGRYRFDPVQQSGDGAVEARLEVDDMKFHTVADYGEARLDRGVAETFWTLVRRYGWFRLAWLEAILRLADHTRSRAEQDGSVAGHGNEDQDADHAQGMSA